MNIGESDMRKMIFSLMAVLLISLPAMSTVYASTGTTGKLTVSVATGTVNLEQVPDISFAGGIFKFDSSNKVVVTGFSPSVTDNFVISNLTDQTSVPIYVTSISGLGNTTLTLNNTQISSGTNIATISGTQFGDYQKAQALTGTLGINFANASDAKNAINGTITYGLVQPTVSE